MSRPDGGSMKLIQHLSSSSSSSDNGNTLLGEKVRTYGRVLARDASSSCVLLEHQGHAVLADLTLCLSGSHHLPAVKDVIGVIAYVEEHSNQWPQLEVHLPYQPAFKTLDNVCLSAIMILDANELNLNLWRQAVETTNALPPLPFQEP